MTQKMLDDRRRYVNGVSVETGEYWVTLSKDGQGRTRAQAEMFVKAQGDWPWRMSVWTRKEFCPP